MAKFKFLLCALTFLSMSSVAIADDQASITAHIDKVKIDSKCILSLGFAMREININDVQRETPDTNNTAAELMASIAKMLVWFGDDGLKETNALKALGKTDAEVSIIATEAALKLTNEYIDQFHKSTDRDAALAYVSHIQSNVNECFKYYSKNSLIGPPVPETKPDAGIAG